MLYGARLHACWGLSLCVFQDGGSIGTSATEELNPSQQQQCNAICNTCHREDNCSCGRDLPPSTIADVYREKDGERYAAIGIVPDDATETHASTPPYSQYLSTQP